MYFSYMFLHILHFSGHFDVVSNIVVIPSLGTLIYYAVTCRTFRNDQINNNTTKKHPN